ncbi:acyl-CoA dehydrogenase family protein [Actinomadura macrotermitis]|uniref:Acyl-CoA dehydrogenase FadE34 n=1 Tax=Actinomadura macrotermitis TaxID=2585200 RepID=A0A7K0C7T7_9ACTN|nr:acyl-CoA dehydrogenase family protein [Actinomadura macrotermitis]MQY09531.1 Acyl-CoA dehydrogenase FadE34 [Actinomadura macrotermitis]
MSLVVSEEQEELRRALRRFFADKSPSAEVRRLMGSAEGYDPKVWAQMAEQIGLQGLAIPEEYGGAGFGMRELAIVFEEMGRALVCAPYLATILGAAAVLAAEDEELKWEVLPGIADGTMIAAVAVEGVTARETAEGWALDGIASYVVDGHLADLVVVCGDDGLFAVQDGFGRTPLPTLDQTRRLTRLEFDGTPARRIGGPRRHVEDVAAVALAAEALGGAQRMLDLTVEYVKVRRQFGRPIGSFQAIKHRCADMFVLVESARSAVLQAAAVADESPEELPMAAAVAKAYCTDAYFQVAGEAVQLHGGIGFTWEHDAHLYFKRAKSCQELFGSAARHRERLAGLVGI